MSAPVFPLRAVLGVVAGFLAATAVLHLVPYDPTAELPSVAAPDAPSGEIQALGPTREPDEVRVFVVGASLTHGYPYTPEACYARQLGAGLRAVLPGRRIAALEHAKPALDSPKLAAMVEPLVRDHAPSLMLVALGSNEFANRIFSGRNLVPQEPLAWVGEHGSRLRMLLRRLPSTSGSAAEQDDFQNRLAGMIDRSLPGVPSFGGLPVPEVDQELLIARMREQMRHMAATCAEHRVPLVFLVAVYGLGGFWPWGISKGGADPAVDELVIASWSGLDDAMLPRVEELLRTRSRRADLHFLHGLLLRRAGRTAAAREAFCRARDLDLVPMHQTGAVLAAIQVEAAALGRPCLLLDQALAERSADGIPGPDHYLDYGHLSEEGHRIVAEFLARELSARELLPALPAGWEPTFRAAAAENVARRVPEVFRQRAQANMGYANGGFSMLFGNFRDALPYLTRAVTLLPDWQDFGLRLLICAYSYAGRRGDLLTGDPEREMALYLEMHGAVQAGRLQGWLQGVLGAR